MDVRVSFPDPGLIQVEGAVFADASSEACRTFLRCAFALAEVDDVRLHPGRSPRAELRFTAGRASGRTIVDRLAKLLGQARLNREVAAEVQLPLIARDRRGSVRVRRFGSRLSGWRVDRESPGQVKLCHPALHRRAEVAQAIERELMSILGVDKYSTNTLFAAVSIDYDPRQLSRSQLVEILDGVLAATQIPAKPDKLDLSLALATASLPLAAAAQFAFPPLLPAAAALFLFTSIPSFQGAKHLLLTERRLGCDVLDVVVILGCLATGQILPGAVLVWCLALGRTLVKRTEDRSKKMLFNLFGKQPRFVWVVQGGVEVQVPLHTLARGDVIVVNTGDVVPVDGVVAEGFAMIDQHALTGESTPAEKGPGERVFASTVLVAGKLFVAVESSGAETASAKIGKILADTAGYKLARQHAGERLADKAVIPMLALGGLGFATLGPAGAVAIVNCDLGTGIRMAAPLAMLSSLSLCASRGILIKDGRALDQMNEIDTVLFDKTGTLTRERPEVGHIHACLPWDAAAVLRFAAAAEQKFHHPIALAILHEARDRGLDLPPVDDSEFKVGFGIAVRLEGHLVRVGSRRYIEMEGIAIPPDVAAAIERAHALGNTMVLVAIDDSLGGGIELQASVRPEVVEIIAGLRARGIKHIAIISGDHDAPTRRLAEQLGMDRYFAQVLPADKADYVSKLQSEGRKVCFVGDGINDSIALKRANVSISLRGASTIATDTAHIVFLDEGLAHLCELRDIAGNLHRNVRRSWHMIVAPNIACVAGVFTLGFGIYASVFFNNITAFAAVANGLWPMRKVAASDASRRRARAAAGDAGPDHATVKRDDDSSAQPPSAQPPSAQPPSAQPPSAERALRPQPGPPLLTEVVMS